MQGTSTLECIDEVVDVVEETNDETVSLISYYCIPLHHTA